MPTLPSPFSAVPQFIQRPATPPQPGMQQGMPPGQNPLLAAIQAMQSQPNPVTGAAPGGNAPSLPGMPDGAPGGGPQGPETGEPDIVQRLVTLMMSHPDWVKIFAGMGLRDALEKSGKFVSKPHRSNEELQGQGYPVGNPGQTGIAQPQDVIRNMMPQTPQGP